jgi:E3 ubiquitin-protein ligase TRIP12
LVEFTMKERAAFLQFVTGCPALPPGGLPALDPPLNIIPKDAAGPVDMALPSTSTCFHQVALCCNEVVGVCRPVGSRFLVLLVCVQLKLPAYTSKDVLKDRLLTAMVGSKDCLDFT